MLGVYPPVSSIKTKEWSRVFVPFKPIDIQIKIDLEDFNLKNGDICQIMLTPDYKYSVGKYNKQGNGMRYLDDITQKNFIEHIHFEFK